MDIIFNIIFQGTYFFVFLNIQFYALNKIIIVLLKNSVQFRKYYFDVLMIEDFIEGLSAQ